MDKKKQEDFINQTVNKTNYILEDTLLDSEVTVDDIKNFKYEDIVKNSTKAKISKLPWLISIFLILIISIVLVYMFLNENPGTIFTNSIDRFFSAITDNISDNNYEISKGKAQFNVSIDSKENSEFFSELSKVNFDIDYTLDSANDLLKIKLNSTYENEPFLDLDIYNDKDNVYVYSSDIYEKYLKIKNESKFKFINPKDIKAILNGLNQAFDKVATSEKIIGDKTSLDLGNKSINIYETKLIINKKNYKKVSETFINTLKSNMEFVSSLAKITNRSNNDVQKYLDKLLLKLKNFFVKNDELEVKLYNDRRSKEFVKGIISGNLGSFTLSKINNDYLFNLIKNNNEKVSGDINIGVNDKKTEYDLDFNLNYYIDEKMEKSLKAKLSYTNNKASSFKRINTSESKSIQDLTDLEKFSIYGKMFSNKNLSKFLKFIK